LSGARPPADALGVARPVRLERHQPTDGAEPDDAKGVGTHGIETSRAARPPPPCTTRVFSLSQLLAGHNRDREIATETGPLSIPLRSRPELQRQEQSDVGADTQPESVRVLAAVERMPQLVHTEPARVAERCRAVIGASPRRVRGTARGLRGRRTIRRQVLIAKA